MKKLFLLTCSSISLISTIMQANQFSNDFNRRYGANSHILNSAVYYKKEKANNNKRPLCRRERRRDFRR